MATKTDSDRASTCRECGTRLAPGLAGLCPKCLLGEGAMAEMEGVIDLRRRSAPAVETIDALFPDYEVSELIGVGGMGAVYKARQSRLERFVAIKILHVDGEHKWEFAERFVREAKTLAKLEHPNIVTIYDYGELDDFYCLIMEYVEGADLSKVIRGGEMTLERALRIVPQICDALQFAHEEGVTHRDIKPGNILLDKRERVKIADFGLAKLVGADVADLTLTGTGTTMGSARYMAPEQWDDSHAVDHRVDIFSLGVIFYEMLTGELPAGRVDPPSQKARVPKKIDDIVFRAMDPSPEKRYEKVEDLKADLDAAAAEMGAKGRGGGRKAAVSAAVAVVLGLALLYLFLRGGEGEGESAIAKRGPSGGAVIDLSAGLPPALRAMKERGGRLRGWGEDKDGRRASDFIAKADRIDDFTSVQVHDVGRWVGQRRDGSLVSQVAPFEEVAGVKMVENEGMALVTNAGEFFCPDPAVIEFLGEDARGVKDLEFAGVLGGVYYVTKDDGSVGMHVRKEPDPGAGLAIPEIQRTLRELRDVRKVAADGQLGIALREDGKVLSWHVDTGFVEPPDDALEIERIACGLQYYMALTAAGRLKIWSCYPVVDPGAVDVESFEPAFELRAKGHVYAVQREDGRWKAWAGTGSAYQVQLGAPEEVAQQINGIGPAVDIAIVSSHPLLLWIESAGH